MSSVLLSGGDARFYLWTIPNPLSSVLLSGGDARFYLWTIPNPLSSVLLSGGDARFYLWTTAGVCFNTHQSKSSFLIKNCVKSFRTKAVTNDRFVTANPEMNFYELLGIPQSGSFSEIKQAHKQLARKYHPDVSPPERVEKHTRRFIQVQEAYETLSDPGRRAMYDRDLTSDLHLAFSAWKRYDQEREQRSNWMKLWQSQLTELKRRSMNKDSRGNISWGARIRRQRNKSSADL